MQGIARGMLKTVEAITTGYTGTTSDDKSIKILGNVREELSKLDYT
jgi:pyridoxal/pyridoxine/pyridoxamine kinase